MESTTMERHYTVAVINVAGLTYEFLQFSFNYVVFFNSLKILK